MERATIREKEKNSLLSKKKPFDMNVTDLEK